MSYTIPDNFKGTTPYNVNSFSLPGLMPTSSPILERQVSAAPDGSILLPLFSIQSGDQNPFPFPTALTTLDKKVLLYDVLGDHLFQSMDDDGSICFSFIVDGTTEAIPVGQTFLEILVNGISKKWVIVHNDSPFTGGKKSGYRTEHNDRPLRYVARDEFNIPLGTTSMFVPFQPQFFQAPLSVVAKALDVNNENIIGVTISEVTNLGFIVTFPAITEEEITLEYIAWSLTAPLSITGIAKQIDEFRVDNNILLG